MKFQVKGKQNKTKNIKTIKIKNKIKERHLGNWVDLEVEETVHVFSGEEMKVEKA